MSNLDELRNRFRAEMESQKWGSDDSCQSPISAAKTTADTRDHLDAEYHFNRGLSYHECSSNKAEAIRWLTKASEMGNAQAMHLLSQLIWKDENSQAMYWLKRSAESGYELSLRDLDAMGVDLDDEDDEEYLDYDDDDEDEEDPFLDDDDIDLDEIWESFTSNLQEILSLGLNVFDWQIGRVTDIINKLHPSFYSVGSLRLLQAYMKFEYFHAHFDSDYFKKNEYVFDNLLDAIENLHDSTSVKSKEIDYLYYVASMYSATRFTHLQECWNNLCEIESDGDHTYLHDMAVTVYKRMKSRLR